DVNANSNMCSIGMQTRDGGNCKAWVTCNDGVKEYNPAGATWNVCYVGGRQFFTDPRIGEFSITFAKKDGSEGEGLTDPILQLKDVDNWKEFPVTALAGVQDQADRCEGGMTPLDCKKGPFICRWIGETNKYIFDSRTKTWECGMPKTGKGGAGLDSNGPVNDRGYRPGWCGVHVTQYQKPDPSKDQYSLDAIIKDANENRIGGTDARGGPALSLGGKLPMTVEVRTGGVDADPVSFGYGGDSWNSNDKGRCSIGAYDNGKREMDCGFTCN
ncbi:hypothetical protein K458DRAFT_295702, partial [Lentithecium fluviatile CBS 122367]